MIYFDSDMSRSTNTVVYFDWKTVINIYVCGKCRTQFMLPMEKSITFTGARANEIIPSINRSFVYKAKEGKKTTKKQQKIPSPFYFMYGRFVHFQLTLNIAPPPCVNICIGSIYQNYHIDNTHM